MGLVHVVLAVRVKHLLPLAKHTSNSPPPIGHFAKSNFLEPLDCAYYENNVFRIHEIRHEAWMSTTITMPSFKVSSMDPKKAVCKFRALFSENEKQFPIMKLPAELRNQIYEYTMKDAPREYWFLRHKSCQPLPGLLQVSDQLNREYSCYYWSFGHFEFVFDFNDSSTFTSFLEDIGNQSRAFLRSNWDVCCRVVFTKACGSYYYDFCKNNLLGSLSVSLLGSPSLPHPIPATHWWVFTVEKPSIRNLSKLVEPGKQQMGVRLNGETYPATSMEAERAQLALRLWATIVLIGRESFQALYAERQY